LQSESAYGGENVNSNDHGWLADPRFLGSTSPFLRCNCPEIRAIGTGVNLR
jgi:hypothetical protein